MDHKNQQPIQEKVESKRPIKTNWKYIAIVVALGLATGLTLIWLAGKDLFDRRYMLKNKVPQEENVNLPISGKEVTLGEEQDKVTVYVKENITNIVRAEPVLGASRFFIDEVKFYEGNKFIATFEDGHILGYLLGKYYVKDGEIQITYLDETVNETDLSDFKQKHGFADIDTSTPSTSSGQAWQTYGNEEFGFEVRYPTEYDVKKFCSPRDGEEESRVFLGPIIIRKVDTGGLTLEAYVSKAVQDAEKKVEKYGDRIFVLESQESITFAGKEALKVVSRFCGAGCYNPTDIYVNNEGDFLRITYDDGIMNQCPFDSYKLPSQVADQILSTFRFVE